MTSGVQAQAQRTVIYGPGGVGKTELCSNLSAIGVKPLFLDIGNSTGFLDVPRLNNVNTWDDVRAALHTADIWRGYDAVVIDDLTKAEELCTQWVVDNVPHENGTFVRNIEGYGYGKGYAHLYEAFLLLLADLDAHIRAGRHVICVAHECTAKVPHPGGEDFIRYEPRLYTPSTNNSGKNSIRSRVKEWCDHLLFVGFDMIVNNDGKAKGSGTRTIYPAELPTHWAKSRKLSDPIYYERGSAEIWTQLFGGKA